MKAYASTCVSLFIFTSWLSLEVFQPQHNPATGQQSLPCQPRRHIRRRVLPVQRQHRRQNQIIARIPPPHILGRRRRRLVDHHRIDRHMRQRTPWQASQQKIPILINAHVGRVPDIRQQVAPIHQAVVRNAVTHEHAGSIDIGDRV